MFPFISNLVKRKNCIYDIRQVADLACVFPSHHDRYSPQNVSLEIKKALEVEIGWCKGQKELSS